MYMVGGKGFMCSKEDEVCESLGKANSHGDAGLQQLVCKIFNIHTFNQDI